MTPPSITTVQIILIVPFVLWGLGMARISWRARARDGQARKRQSDEQLGK